MRRVAGFALIVLLVFAFNACSKKTGTKGAYLVKVGNATITEADLDREMKNLPEFAQAMFAGSSGKERFLDELIKKEILYQEALKKGIDKDPQYKAKVEDFKKITLVGLLLERVIEEKSKVTPEDVKEYYEKNKDEVSPATQIRVSQIIVKTSDEANSIYEKLKKGEDFAKIAKQSSIDPGSAKSGGDLGYLGKGQMKPEIESVAVKLKVGQISPPVKISGGYLLVKVTDKKLGKPLEFDKVKNLIAQRLAAEKQKVAFDSYLDELRKTYKVEMNKEAISQLSGPEKQGEMAPEKPAAPNVPIKKKD
jgi:peptidyl-prolyl cis-trans isomerase C